MFCFLSIADLNRKCIQGHRIRYWDNIVRPGKKAPDIGHRMCQTGTESRSGRWFYEDVVAKVTVEA